MKKAGITAVVAGIVVVAASSAAWALPTVPAGYTIDVYYQNPSVVQDPFAMAFAPESNFGYAGNLFVSYYGSNRSIWRITGQGTAVKFADHPSSAHEVLEFSTADTGFGEKLYGPMYDTIYSYSSTGVSTAFANVGELELCGFAFGPGGRWGKNIYLLESAGANADGDAIHVYTPSGSKSTLISNLPENEKCMAFSPGGDWGDYLYIGAWSYDPAIRRVDPNGVLTDFVTGRDKFGYDTALISMAFGTSGYFKNKLYVSDWGTGKIYEIDSSGNVSTFGSGFAFDGTITGDIVFGPDGGMYVADAGTDTIYRIVPEPTTLGLLSLGALALLRRRQRA